MTPSGVDRTAGMRRQRHTQSEAKHHAVRTSVDTCVTRGLPESAAGIARDAGTTETFLYRHEARPCAICDDVFGSGPVSYYRVQMRRITDSRDQRSERDGRVTAATAQADLANTRAANQRLRQQVRALERRLGEVTGEQVEAGLPELARLARDVDPPAGRHISELSDQVRQLTLTLAERDEELDAVRRLNADLTRRLNSHTLSPREEA